MTEAEFLKAQIEELKAFRADLPSRFETAQKQVEDHVNGLMEQAGILAEVKRTRDELEKFRLQLQKQADVSGAKLDLCEQIFDKYHRNPVAEGTVLHGIDISKLDWQTRLQVQNGNVQTIAALGGRLDEASPAGFESPTLTEATVEEEASADTSLDDLQDLAARQF